MASGSHDQTKAAAVAERAKCARLSSAHAHQGRGAAYLIVVHNRVRGKPRLGSNGFRAWLARPAARYVRCDCKWATHLAVHYRVEQDGSGVKAGRSSAPQVVCCFRRRLALAARLTSTLWRWRCWRRSADHASAGRARASNRCRSNRRPATFTTVRGTIRGYWMLARCPRRAAGA